MRKAVGLRILCGLFGNSRCRAADVEGTHGELRSGFADGLRGDDADRFAAFYQTARGQVAAIAKYANAALRFASQYGTNLHTVRTSTLNTAGKRFRNFFVYADNDITFEIQLIFLRHTAYNAVA